MVTCPAWISSGSRFYFHCEAWLHDVKEHGQGSAYHTCIPSWSSYQGTHIGPLNTFMLENKLRWPLSSYCISMSGRWHFAPGNLNRSKCCRISVTTSLMLRKKWLWRKAKMIKPMGRSMRQATQFQWLQELEIVTFVVALSSCIGTKFWRDV